MLDEWEADDGEDVSANVVREVPEVRGAVDMVASTNQPLFSLEILQQNIAKYRGEITAMAAARGKLLIGTNRGWLLRQDFSTGEISEIDLNIPRWGEQFVLKVFLDPGGNHGLISLGSTMGGGETLYLHSQWKKSRVLGRLKGAIINSVAWNNDEVSEACTNDVVIGTTGGQLFQLLVEEKDKKEKYLKLLFDLQEQREPICGLQALSSSDSGGSVQLAVLAVTPSKLFLFHGADSLEKTFETYQNRLPRTTEFPGKFLHTELHCSTSTVISGDSYFSWLAGSGIFHGELKFSGASEEATVERKGLLEYSEVSRQRGKPKSMAVTDFHLLLLFESSISVVNRVSLSLVEEISLVDSRYDGGTANLIGFCTDKVEGTVYGFSQSSIFELSSEEESRDMWKTFLERNFYEFALQTAKSEREKEEVFLAQAEASFSAKDFVAAASYLDKAEGLVSFEECVLRLMNLGAQDALGSYLQLKLKRLDSHEVTQRTMLATWALELLVDKMNFLSLESKPSELRKQKQGSGVTEPTSDSIADFELAQEELRSFLSDHGEDLEESTAMKILSSYGREEELVYFARVKGNHEQVLQHSLRKGDAEQVFLVLEQSQNSLELQYKYGPQIMRLSPVRAVDLWIKEGEHLSPQSLIPALLQFSDPRNSGDSLGSQEAIRYLNFCVDDLGLRDASLHNLLLSLYAKQEDESALIRFLTRSTSSDQSGGSSVSGPVALRYDPKYALRVCLENGRLRSCVCIYGLVGMHREAVALALKIDLGLAKAEANKAEDDEELRKKLWLIIARHVIANGSPEEGIRQAIAFLRETEGLLKVEDLLPFFPDFTLIDDVKEAISSALDDYAAEIESLKGEMEEATLGAEKIRADMAALTQRWILVQKEDVCEFCRKALLEPTGLNGAPAPSTTPFYVFPCSHSFHSDCLSAHLLKHCDAEQRETITSLRTSLRSLLDEVKNTRGPKKEAERKSLQSQAAKAQLALDHAMASDCPFCGDLMIDSITQPFVEAHEAELECWTVY